MAKPQEVNEADFESKVLKSSIPAMVDFWAVWCGPCKMIAPFVDELAEDFEGKLAVFKVDVDANPGIAEKCGIQSIPTLLVFQGGQVAKQMVGYMPKAQIKKGLAEAGIS